MVSKVLKFLSDVKKESLNVSWANKGEVLGFLLIVLLVVTFMSVFFCAVDFLFFKIVRAILEVIYGL